MAGEIVIKWEGPYNTEEVTKNFNVDSDVEKRWDCGLYQIYGPHPLYGNKKRDSANVLLYIGKTTEGTFAGRICEHGFCHTASHEIYLGRVEGIQYEDEKKEYLKWRQDISDAEKILINNYAPSYNSDLCGDLRRHQLNSQDCVVRNLNSKADLDDAVEAEYLLEE